jgi:hypothetical protein
MNKVNLRVEKIFAHAAALQQNGRLRNTIYGINRQVYIMNQDHTVLIRFPLRSSEPPFSSPISFSANDYDSETFAVKKDKICFIQKQGDFIREKSCKTPQYTPSKIQSIYKSIFQKIKKRNAITLNQDFVNCLDDSLSHVEFSSKQGKLTAIQRNIYTGSVISISKNTNKKALIQNAPLRPFKPLGIRTNDLLALFTFVDTVTFYFIKNMVAFESGDKSMPFVGVLSQCIYDELGIK